MDVVWEKPSFGPWFDRLEPVMERPGKWARVYEAPTPQTANTTASGLRSGRFKIPDGEFEFKYDGIGVYARYLGPTPLADSLEASS